MGKVAVTYRIMPDGAEVDARLRARARLLQLAGTLEKPISPAHLQTIVSGLAD